MGIRTIIECYNNSEDKYSAHFIKKRNGFNHYKCGVCMVGDIFANKTNNETILKKCSSCGAKIINNKNINK